MTIKHWNLDSEIDIREVSKEIKKNETTIHIRLSNKDNATLMCNNTSVMNEWITLFDDRSKKFTIVSFSRKVYSVSDLDVCDYRITYRI